jgi:hypothetical protein
MTPDEFNAFTRELVAGLREDEDVLGLVALGSMAAIDTQPDAWSDHDFWIVTVPGGQERWRCETAWLPQADRVIFQLRETAHGVKVVYESGHLLEYAVFDLGELQVARVNRYRILLDRVDLAARMAALRDATAAAVAGERRDDAWLVGQFLTNLLVGLGRHARGEALSGHAFVRSYALEHLVRLLARHVAAPRQALLDDLAPLRRFERVYPGLGAEVVAGLNRPVPETTLVLLTIAERELAPRLSAWPADLAAVIRRLALSLSEAPRTPPLA